MFESYIDNLKVRQNCRPLFCLFKSLHLSHWVNGTLALRPQGESRPTFLREIARHKTGNIAAATAPMWRKEKIRVAKVLPLAVFPYWPDDGCVNARSTSVTTIRSSNWNSVEMQSVFFLTWVVDSHYQIKQGKSQTEKQTTQHVVS